MEQSKEVELSMKKNIKRGLSVFFVFYLCLNQALAGQWVKGTGKSIKEATENSVVNAELTISTLGYGCLKGTDSGVESRILERHGQFVMVETFIEQELAACNSQKVTLQDLQIKTRETVNLLNSGTLPSRDMRYLLSNIATSSKERKSKPLNLQVNLNNMSDNTAKSMGLDKRNDKTVASVPFAIPNTLIVKFKEGTTKEEMDEFLSSRKANILSVQANIGTIQIETDLSKYFAPSQQGNSANDAFIRGFLLAVDDFEREPLIEKAAPDLLLRTQTLYTNLSEPSDYVLADSINEKTDWGIEDIQANKLWNMPEAFDGTGLGVMDSGFARHEDLVFAGFARNTNVSNHGNHVAGIACAKHNGKGVKGVIPNCHIRAKTSVRFATEDGPRISRFMQSFGQILATLNDFLPSNPDTKVYNVSLGYNWIPNFAINPDESVNAQWRSLVASQGELFISVLSLAAERDQVVFSAAGNDSRGLDDPIDAKYASPMNWAAITARERGLAYNGVTVEAHDKVGKRASFSNEKNHISCPGVDILSTVAVDQNGNVSRDMYAHMSGTSMASPYCAAGYALLSIVRPNYQTRELLQCLFDSGDASDTGIPMMRLDKAANRCPARP